MVFCYPNLAAYNAQGLNHRQSYPLVFKTLPFCLPHIKLTNSLSLLIIILLCYWVLQRMLSMRSCALHSTQLWMKGTVMRCLVHHWSLPVMSTLGFTQNSGTLVGQLLMFYWVLMNGGLHGETISILRKGTEMH